MKIQGLLADFCLTIELWQNLLALNAIWESFLIIDLKLTSYHIADLFFLFIN